MCVCEQASYTEKAETREETHKRPVTLQKRPIYPQRSPLIPRKSRNTRGYAKEAYCSAKEASYSTQEPYYFEETPKHERIRINQTYTHARTNAQATALVYTHTRTHGTFGSYHKVYLHFYYRSLLQKSPITESIFCKRDLGFYRSYQP